MHGNQKSSKIEALKDQYGRVVYNRHDLYDMLYNGEDISTVSSVEWHEDFEKYNHAIEANHLRTQLYSAIEKLSLSKEEFDRQNQSEWFMPDEYKNYPIYDYCIRKCDTIEQKQRVMDEFDEYDSRGLLPLLYYMKYLVDTMRKHNILWGVGRGSSVASYVLYIIGIHRINSIQYNLDYKEFLR